MKSTGQVFYWISFNLGFSNTSLLSRLGLRVFGKKTTEWSAPLITCIRGACHQHVWYWWGSPSSPGHGGVMINFTCQLHWAIGCPDSWLNSVWGCSVRVFLEEMSIWIGDLSKAYGLPSAGSWEADGLPSAGRRHPIHGGPTQNRKMEEGWLCSLPPCWAGPSIFCPSAPGCWAFRLGLEFMPSVLQLSGLWTTPPAFLGL